MKSIAIVNSKGGSGKTTTAINLAASLVIHHKKKVLLIDTDPQMNATVSLIEAKQWEKIRKNEGTLYYLLNDKIIEKDKLQIEKYIIKNVIKSNESISLDLIASDFKLFEFETNRIRGIEFFLSDLIETIADTYDFVIFDCSPSIGLLTTNALIASKYFIIPTTLDSFSITSLQFTIKTLKEIKSNYEMQCELIGILIIKKKMVIFENKLEKVLRQQFGEIIFNASIPDTVNIPEAAFHLLPIFSYKEKSAASKAYYEFSMEFLERLES